MSIFEICWTVAIAIGLAYWAVSALFVARAIRRTPLLGGEAAPETWPRLSVVITARDEATTLPAAMKARLEDDYPEVEFILVNDRSTDGTGRIIDDLAAADPRVRAVHVTDLPEGWLGKVHALERGVEGARGDWLLFTDADVHFEAGTLRAAVARALADGIDHLPVLPEIDSAGFLLDVWLSCFGRMFLLTAIAAASPRSRAAIGVGAFNLVRREVLDRSEGLVWLRMEVIDDAGLGLLVKRAGGKTRLCSGRGLVHLTWYECLGDAIVAAERGGFVLAGFSMLRALSIAPVALWLELSPFLALLPIAPSWLRIAGAAFTAVALATSAAASRFMRRPILAALLFPLGSVLTAGILARAGVLGFRRGGIVWRGTLYPTALLRAGQRLKLL